MRKSLYCVLVGQLITLLFAMNTLSPAFASTERAIIRRPPLTRGAPSLVHRKRSPLRRYPHRGLVSNRSFRYATRQVNNQFFRATVKNTNNKTYRGHDQGNSGNHGYNRGYNEDNSSNSANQIINRRSAIQYRRNNQYYQIHSENSGNLRYYGYRQANSGNSGYNSGFNRDNSSNFGNQIID